MYLRNYFYSFAGFLFLSPQLISGQANFQELADLSYKYARSNIDSCFYYANLLKTTAESSKEEYWIQKSQYYLGVCYSCNSENYKSEKALNGFLEYAIATNEISDQAHARYELAQDYNSNEEPARVISTLNLAIEGFEETNDQLMIAKSLVTKSILLRKQRLYDASHEAVDGALKTYIQIQDSTGISEAYNAKAILLFNQGDVEGGVDYFLKQTVIDEKRNDLVGLGHSLGNLGFAYLQMNEITKGERYINRALEIRRELGFPYELASSLIQIAEVNVLKKDYNQALEYSEEALDISLNNNLSGWREQCYRQLSFIHEKKGDATKALDFYKKYERLKDSLFNVSINETAQKVEGIYQNAEKEKEIIKLQAEEELSKQQLMKQRFAIGGLGIGLGLLSWLLYRIFGQKKQIQSQNAIISSALNDKETLLKEIHHRVKNNLQVVSSLLRLQSSHTDDEVALEALKEGQSRVQSMSLIHQNLYQHDNLRAISMPAYLDNLVQSLLQTYQLTPDRIKVESDISDIILDVDTVVPLGLIINELITNALKYAFIGREEGEINIKLKDQGDHLLLVVQDNGVGIPNDFKEGFGMGLIKAFVNKLEAELDIQVDKGTIVSVLIKEFDRVT